MFFHAGTSLSSWTLLLFLMCRERPELCQVWTSSVSPSAFKLAAAAWSVTFLDPFLVSLVGNGSEESNPWTSKRYSHQKVIKREQEQDQSQFVNWRDGEGETFSMAVILVTCSGLYCCTLPPDTGDPRCEAELNIEQTPPSLGRSA